MQVIEMGSNTKGGSSRSKGGDVIEIDAAHLYYKDLNRMIKDHAWAGKKRFRIINAYGQRYIGTGVDRKIKIEIATATAGISQAMLCAAAASASRMMWATVSAST